MKNLCGCVLLTCTSCVYCLVVNAKMSNMDLKKHFDSCNYSCSHM